MKEGVTIGVRALNDIFVLGSSVLHTHAAHAVQRCELCLRNLRFARLPNFKRAANVQTGLHV
jgi:hypothetical protein